MPLPVIDASRLATLRSDYGEDVTGELVADFARTGTELGKRLNQAAADGDAAELNETAHELRGGARTMGLERLAGLCQEIEAACTDGRHADALRMTRELDACFLESVAALEKEGSVE
ncbi:MAG: Hpt domain-containing protein [Rhodospirillales bacterium]|nr:Hpt domain-containing protein [Rhodospirillales bacterium]